MRKVKRIVTILMMGVCLLASVSCNDKSQNDAQIVELTRERDSIATLADNLNQEHQELIGYIQEIEKAIDSVAYEEKILIIGKDEDNRPLSPKQMRERVKAFGKLIQRQRQYIKNLEDSLANKSGSPAHLLSIITSLRTQLEAKNSELDKLRVALKNEKATTAQMQQIIGSMDQTNKLMASENAQLTSALVAQNEAANIGYKLIATKSELEKLGILSGGGFLKKKKLDYSAFNQDNFESVDIRYYDSHVIKAKKVKMLTSAPKNSYTLTKISNDEWQLKILSPADFWSISNFMIIQIN